MSKCSGKNILKKIVSELDIAFCQISEESLKEAVEVIFNTKRIFLAGAGRSALGIRGFAMRLMHMGKTAYVVGETTTPNITKDDLLIIGSGSGRSASLVTMAQKARDSEVQILLITATQSSPIGQIADHIIEIPVPTPKNENAKGKSIQPMGSLFEQSLFILLDGLVLLLMEKAGLTSDGMFKQHANLE